MEVQICKFVQELLDLERCLSYPSLVVGRSAMTLLVMVLTYGYPAYLVGKVKEKRNPGEKLLEESLDPLDERSVESIHFVDQLKWAPPENIPHHQTSLDQRSLIPVEIHQGVAHCDSNALPDQAEADDYLERAEKGQRAL